MTIDFKKIKKIHFAGIKGVGMTALALCAQDMGIKVSGSDVAEKFVTDEILRKRKIYWQTGFAKKHLSSDTDLLIFTASHGGKANAEVLAAQERRMPILSQAQAVAEFMKGKMGVSCCGVGGKSTTAAMLATILDNSGLKPSFAIGVGNIPSLGVPGSYKNIGKYFVAEADEYFDPLDGKPKFLFQNPEIIILTNIEYDHPDVYPNLEATMKAYRSFVEKLPCDGLLVANIDNPKVQRLIKTLSSARFKIKTFGFSPGADFQITDYHLVGEKAFFQVAGEEYYLTLPGKFNAANAAASVVAAKHLKLNHQEIRKGLEKFRGVKRRFEKIAEVDGMSLYDDYAHHPLEIQSTLAAAKEWFPGRRIIAVFQPHTYSRTKYLLPDFAKSFGPADLVIVTKIYASAREREDLGISGEILTKEISKNHKRAIYLADSRSVCNFLRDKIKKGDVIFTFGAGGIFLWQDKIIKILIRRPAEKIQKDIILAPFTTFRIGGSAEYFVEANNIREIIASVRWAKENKIPYFILGGGSNVLIADKGIRGLVIKVQSSKFKVQSSKLTCDAGLMVNKIVKILVEKGWGGLEYFAGLPGTVAGSIYKNSHWHKHFFSDNLIAVKVLTDNLLTKKILKKDLKFSYDWSSLQGKKWIILEAEFQLKKEKNKVLEETVKKIMERRNEQPKGKSAGCIFKNPPGQSAGFLIEETGMKGKTLGRIKISEQHANFFINLGGGKAREVLELIKIVQKKVKNKFGIILEPEVFFGGDFNEKIND